MGGGISLCNLTNHRHEVRIYCNLFPFSTIATHALEEVRAAAILRKLHRALRG